MNHSIRRKIFPWEKDVSTSHVSQSKKSFFRWMYPMRNEFNSLWGISMCIAAMRVLGSLNKLSIYRIEWHIYAEIRSCWLKFAAKIDLYAKFVFAHSETCQWIAVQIVRGGPKFYLGATIIAWRLEKSNFVHCRGIHVLLTWHDQPVFKSISSCKMNASIGCVRFQIRIQF